MDRFTGRRSAYHINCNGIAYKNESLEKIKILIRSYPLLFKMKQCNVNIAIGIEGYKSLRSLLNKWCKRMVSITLHDICIRRSF